MAPSYIHVAVRSIHGPYILAHLAEFDDEAVAEEAQQEADQAAIEAAEEDEAAEIAEHTYHSIINGLRPLDDLGQIQMGFPQELMSEDEHREALMTLDQSDPVVKEARYSLDFNPDDDC